MLATKCFTAEGQRRFAELSGDFNPIHLDPGVARRTQAGAVIVHGLHIVLWCLDAFARRSVGYMPTALQARFIMPVIVGETLAMGARSVGGREVSIEVKCNDMIVASLVLASSGRTLEPIVRSPEEAPGTWSLQPRELAFQEIACASGSLPFSATIDLISAAFPAAAAWLGPVRVAALAALSRLVGMECPGHDSLFSSFKVDLTSVEDAACLAYAVVSADQRFRLVRLRVSAAGVSGTVDAFARPPPTRQPSIDEVSAVIRPREFAGHDALVVGGSRGLGETTAKIIAAGGGHPVITYAVGRDDALRVADELASWGAPCGVLRYDVREPSAPQLGELAAAPNYIYYFASGPIARRPVRRFDPALLSEFITFYVEGFNDLCVAVAQLKEDGFSAFYPSSVFVTARPVGFTEYAMAKLAGEALCTDLQTYLPKSRISTERLPRVLTDQTAGVLPVSAAPALEVMLPIVREMQAPRPAASEPEKRRLV